MNQLTTLQEQILLQLYHYRCATYTHLYRYICRDHTAIHEAVNQLIEADFIERDDLKEGDDEIYFFLSKGLKQAKKLIKHQDPNQPLTHRTTKELRLAPRAYAHYVETLDFVLEAEAYLKTQQIPYQVKLTGNFQTFDPVKPDAVIQVGNTLFLVETDMLTERSKRLREKMRRYQLLAAKRAGYEDSLPQVVVLFSYCRQPTAVNLTHLYEAIGTESINSFSSSLDFLAGRSQDLLHLFQTELIPEALGKEAPYRQINYTVMKKHLASEGVVPGFFKTNPTTAKGKVFDYGFAKQTSAGIQYQTLVIDLTIPRLSRLCTLHYLKNTLTDWARKGRFHKEGEVIVLIDESKCNTMQLILKAIGWESQPYIRFIKKRS